MANAFAIGDRLPKSLKVPTLGTVTLGAAEASVLPAGAKAISGVSTNERRSTSFDLDADGKADVERTVTLDTSGKPWLTEYRQASGALDGFNVVIKAGRVADIAVYIGRCNGLPPAK